MQKRVKEEEDAEEGEGGGGGGRRGEEEVEEEGNILLLSLYIRRPMLTVSHIGENSIILTRYVTSYQTKAEENEAEGVWKNLEQNKFLKLFMR
ncbi:Hypothetical predicted protein [Octopus vulgaris]|uniref:Uncharacterized protein n=1 Tax=Octopus vulgaris TaxID=6645 RepID=A0AA36FLC2_OCTVU|nr:Hypothetical predicted protein [Octopus vulgaris]